MTDLVAHLLGANYRFTVHTPQKYPKWASRQLKMDSSSRSMVLTEQKTGTLSYVEGLAGNYFVFETEDKTKLTLPFFKNRKVEERPLRVVVIGLAPVETF